MNSAILQQLSLAAIASCLALGGHSAEVVEVPTGTTQRIPVMRPAKYTIYRFVTKKIGAGNVTRLQFGELALYDANGTRINANLTETAYETANIDMPEKSCKLGGWCDHGTANHIDYLFINYFPSGINTWANPTEGSAGTWHHIYMRLADDAPAVASYNIAAGAGGTTVNSPTAWSLEGSDNGTTWTVLDAVSSEESPYYIPANLEQGYYNSGSAILLMERVPWRTEYHLYRDSVLSVTGNVEMGTVKTTNGHIELLRDVTATAKVALGTMEIGGLTGMGRLEKTGSGDLQIGGDNSAFSGRIVAQNGNIRFVASRQGVQAKYWRFCIRQLNLDGTHKYCQIGELALYDSDGTRINLGLTFASGVSSVTSMPNGTAATSEIGGRFYASTTVAKAFDSDLNTSAEGWAECQASAAWTHGYIYMCLSEDAPAVFAYNFSPGPDPVNNWFFNPIAWSLESSDDGMTWIVQDEVDAETGTSLMPTSVGAWYGSDGNFDVTSPVCLQPKLATLEVQSGGTITFPSDMVEGQTNLAIDMAAFGAGEIVNMRFADAGSLHLTCDTSRPKFSGYLLPIVFSNPQEMANVTNWTVVINGAVSDHYRLSVGAGNKIQIDRIYNGMCLIYR